MALIYLKQVQRLSTIPYRLSPNCLSIRNIVSSTNKYRKVEYDDVTDKPIEYSKSEAAKWKAQVTRRGAIETGPWYQSYVILASLSVFMVYFFYLREESDIDLEFDKNLYDRISGLEEKQLEIVLQYNKEHSLPTSDIETRLKEIRSEK